jgi:hypothetical protein
MYIVKFFYGPVASNIPYLITVTTKNSNASCGRKHRFKKKIEEGWRGGTFGTRFYALLLTGAHKAHHHCILAVSWIIHTVPEPDLDSAFQVNPDTKLRINENKKTDPRNEVYCCREVLFFSVTTFLVVLNLNHNLIHRYSSIEILHPKKIISVLS